MTSCDICKLYYLNILDHCPKCSYSNIVSSDKIRPLPGTQVARIPQDQVNLDFVKVDCRNKNKTMYC